MVFYSLSSVFIQLLGDKELQSLPEDIQKRLVVSSSWSFGVSVISILSILGIQSFSGLFTNNYDFSSVRASIAATCLMILLPLCICTLTLKLWSFLKVRDRVYERRCDTVLEVCTKPKLQFMILCGGICLLLTIFLRELICSPTFSTAYILRNSPSSGEEWDVNEMPIFLLTWAAFSGVAFAGKMFVFNADTLVFKSTESTKLYEVAALTFYSIIPRAAKATIRQMVYFLPLYYLLLRQLGIYSICAMILGVPGRPSNFVINIILNFQLMTYSVVAGLCLHIILETLLLSLRVQNTQSLPFPLVREAFELQTDVLLTYLQSDKAPPLQYMALQRLAEISQSPSPADRRPIFQLSELGGHAHTWKAVVSHCRNLLSMFLKEVKAANANLLHKGHIPRTIAMQRSVLPEHLLARLHVGDSSPLAKPRNGTTATAADEKRWMWSLVHERLVQSRLVQFIQAPLPLAVSMRLFSGSQAALWAAETMAHLAVASVVEDEFGVVQPCLVELFDLLADIHEAVEKHLKLSGLFTLGASSPPASVALFYSEPDMPWRFRGSLNRAVLRLVETFASHLDALDIRKQTRTLFETMIRR